MDKLITVTQSSMPAFEEYIEEIRDLWDSKWLSNRGAKHRKFEAELSKLLDVKNIALFANGHVALELAIDAFCFPKGSEVITTPYTHCSTTHSIVRNGLSPVFCDINNKDYTLDINQIEKHITRNTVAIVPTHVYGNVCDVYAIEEIAEKHGLKVIYDAAHAFGITINGKGVANFGDAAMFSTHATKVFQTIEGGITVFNDDTIYNKIDQMTNFGYVTPESVEYISTNARMNEFEAAMGLCNLRHFDNEIAKRQRITEKYSEFLSEVKGITLQQPQPGVTRNYSYFAVFFENFKKDRNQIQSELHEQNILARKYFYPIVPDLKCYQPMFPDNHTPIAQKAAASVLSLPLYPDLELDDVKRICDIILK